MILRSHVVACVVLAVSLLAPKANGVAPMKADQPGVYQITDFGAQGDGRTVNTAAIQKAIAECNADGGGAVRIPPGEFVTGTVRLLSNVHLELEAGAVLSGSTDLADYSMDGVKEGIIFADDAENVAISGFGTINGRGTYFHLPDRLNPSGGDKKYTRQGDDYLNPRYGTGDGPIGYVDRPGMMVVLLRCTRVSIRDITLKDSPMYAFRIGNCDDVTITGVTIFNNPLIPNNDGIHCTTSRNVHISNCHIEAGDDAIVVTGFPYGIYGEGGGTVKSGPATYGNKTNRSENVTVTNCTLSSRSAGIRVGYGENDIRNCTFHNIVIFGSNRGIGVFARDAGSIENVIFSDIIIETRLFTGGWWGAGEPIHVSAVPEASDGKVGRISRITFSNISAQSEAGIVLFGTGESPLREIVLDNVHLTIKNGPLSLSYGGNFDLRPAYRPPMQLFKHDIPGVYAQFLEQSRLEHIDLTWGENLPSYFTHGIEIESSHDVLIVHFHGSGAPNAKGAKDVEVRDSQRVKLE